MDLNQLKKKQYLKCLTVQVSGFENAQQYDLNVPFIDFVYFALETSQYEYAQSRPTDSNHIACENRIDKTSNQENISLIKTNLAAKHTIDLLHSIQLFVQYFETVVFDLMKHLV